MRPATATMAVLLLLLATPAVFCQGTRVVVGEYPMPVAEAVQIAKEWLEAAGFAVSTDWSEGGKALVTGERGGRAVAIEVLPRSPLASRLEATGADRPTLDGLRASLQRGEGRSPGRVKLPARQLPAKILRQQQSVVCLNASAKGEHLQFTGFVIDRRGLILGTAHDIDAVHTVTSDDQGGQEVRGEIVKQDVRRDLSVIRVPRSFRRAVSVAGGRRRLKPGDAVFAVGCPEGELGRWEAGVVDRTPAIVNGQPLWQVTMEVLPGSSGSPVFDAEGRLVGVVKGRYRGTETRGFVIPLETVMEFLEQGKR